MKHRVRRCQVSETAYYAFLDILDSCGREIDHHTVGVGETHQGALEHLRRVVEYDYADALRAIEEERARLTKEADESHLTQAEALKHVKAMRFKGRSLSIMPRHRTIGTQLVARM